MSQYDQVAPGAFDLPAPVPPAQTPPARTLQAQTPPVQTPPAVADVARTARDDLHTVADEVAGQARRVTFDARQALRQQAERRQQELADRIGTMADDLRKMAAGEPETPARALVGQLAERGSALADYVSRRDAKDVYDEVQEFARRRPGTFLVAAAAAGFVVGRLGKGVWQAQDVESPPAGGDHS